MRDMVHVCHRRGCRLRHGRRRALGHLRWSARHALTLRRLTVGARHGVRVLHLLGEAVATTRASGNARVVDGLLQSVLLTAVVVAVRVETLRRHTVHVLLVQNR